ncbi:MAG: hypothetical protein SOH65_10190 [Bifidobacterium sp.]|jgi:hypothetical protein
MSTTTPNTTDIDQSEYAPQPTLAPVTRTNLTNEAPDGSDNTPVSQFTPAQRKIIYIATFAIGVVTIVAAPVVAAVSAPAWVPALIGGLGSAGAMVSAAFGWKYLGR